MRTTALFRYAASSGSLLIALALQHHGRWHDHATQVRLALLAGLALGLYSAALIAWVTHRQR